MRKIERFEDLVAWQKARELTKSVYSLTRQERFARDFGLASQMQRSAVSIMSNIAEGAERTRVNELHHFLGLAKGSAAEVRSQSYVAYDAGYLTEAQFTTLLADTHEVCRFLGGLRASIDRARS